MNLTPNSNISNYFDLVKYIRLMLGEPLIQVELTDDHILQVIQDTVKIYTDVAYGFMETAELAIAKGVGSKFRFIDWDEVTGVFMPNGSTPVPYRWDSIKRIATIMSDIKGEILVRGQQRYQVDPEFDLVFNESWVKDFAKAKTQVLWGQVLGKFSQNLVGGASINYDRIISEGQTEVDRLLEELHEKWMDPAPVIVG